jgi:hypothetical protein
MPFLDRVPRLRRLLPIVLLMAAVFVYFGWISPTVIETHAVTLELPGSTDRITRVEALWTSLDQPPGEAAAGSTFHFQAGTAPRRIRTTVHAPSGPYWLEVTVTGGQEPTVLRQRVVLESGEMTVFLTEEAR